MRTRTPLTAAPAPTEQAARPPLRASAGGVHDFASVAVVRPGALQRQPPREIKPPVQGQLTLTIRSDGRVDATVSGPEDIPVVSAPTVGIRREPDGRWRLLVGGRGTVVAANEIPAILRSALGGAGGASAAAARYRLPSCPQLATMTFRTYEDTRRLFYAPGTATGGVLWLPMTPALFATVQQACRGPALPPPEPAGEPVLPPPPEGTAYA